MPVITIDGKEYDVKAGDNLLQACLSLGLDLPYFCWHPDLGSIGACRQCAVVQYQNTEDNRGRIVMGCMTPVTEGAIFSLSGDKAAKFRENVVEALMLNHPHDCPVCAEGGECHLQDMTVMVGHRDRSYRGKKNTHRNQYLGPLIHHEMNRCITCYRCTRYYKDYAGGDDLAAMASHDHVYFGRHEEGVLESEFAGNLVEVCPTGVFTDKSLVNEYTRKWDLQSAPSVCTGCAVGCNILPGERYGKLKRVHNRFNHEVNGYFLCDRGRFGAQHVNSKKTLASPGIRNENGKFDAIGHLSALGHMVEACQTENIAAIGSPRASVESNYLLRSLVGDDNYCPGFNSHEQSLVNRALHLQQNSSAEIPSIKTMESADAILILGEDLTNTAPRVALALRQSVRNKAYEMAAELKLQPWQDAAIRNLAQDQLSPLFIASVSDTRLDDVAEQQLSLAPPDIARLGAAIAAAITGNNSGDAAIDLGDENNQQAKHIAQTLLQAKRPLIISGVSCGSNAVMDAAAEISQALCNANKPCLFNLVVPEANSLGQALLVGPNAPSLDTLRVRATGGNIDTLIVMENDIYRRDGQTNIEQLLSSVKKIIVLDSLDNPTLSAAYLALSAANFAESEGTLISMEGRAQRYFPVYLPQGERRASWAWLLACLKELGREQFASIEHFDDITEVCAKEIPALAGIIEAAPNHLFRNVGVKVPRQTHRYSGRTAMHADVSMHEPKQPVDEESPLAFTMEGLNRNQPGSLLPYVWSPGWNSNQALHKFQSEVGGALKGDKDKGGAAGNRILNRNAQAINQPYQLPEAFIPKENEWLLVPRHKIYGSDELSVHSPAIAQLVEQAFIEVHPDDANRLQVANGDGLTVGQNQATLAVKVNPCIVKGCAAYSVAFEGTFNLAVGESLSLQKATNWQPQTTNNHSSSMVIASDGGAHV
ncbi:MAG: NADH-quinone oxidoreductase subunit G [Pseudohongiellaceae bacterium]|jgi:NADH-quinone oxidoreductase subunit G